MWLMVCAILFAIVHIFNGIKFQNETIQYVFIGGNPFDFIQTIKDFGVVSNSELHHRYGDF